MSEYDIAEAQRALGYTFKDIEILRRSMRHASVAESRLESNERLEFLGDAILGMIVCERIFILFPHLLEGEMTKIKSLAVSRTTCAEISIEIGLDKLIVVGKGMRTHKELPQSLAAAILESVIAALYMDGGIEAARGFLEPLVDPAIHAAERSGHQHNFKSMLQQHAQQTLGIAPCYRILDEKGPDHAKSFYISVEIKDKSYEPCWGQSKKEAEQQAAMRALRSMGLIEVDANGQAEVTKK
ncbi:MAG: ribonuclease III [Phycisphaerales bacterium]|nr:ribonuclease III [Phycisphaerales bacterium]